MHLARATPQIHLLEVRGPNRVSKRRPEYPRYAGCNQGCDYGRRLLRRPLKQDVEFLVSRVRPPFLLELGQTNRPTLLVSAMLARNLIQAALQGLAKAKVVAAEREYLAGVDRVEHPIRQLDLDFLHPAITGFPNDPVAVDQAETVQYLCIRRGDIGENTGAGKPLERGSELLIAPPVRTSVR